MSDSDSNIEIIADKEEDLSFLQNFKFKSCYLKKARFEPFSKTNISNMPLSLNNTENPPTNAAASAAGNSSGPPQINMITDKSELNMLLNAIPEYFPGNNLSIFITEVDSLINHLRGRLSTDLTYVVDFAIRNKIKGDARDFVAYQNAIAWDDIKTALLNKYGDQRSEELLEAALRQCIQYRNETYLDFYSRVLRTHNELMQHITLHNRDPNLVQFKKFEYNKLALKSFQIGLLEPYRTYISNFELHTLEECLNKCKFYDNRKQEWEYCEYIRRSNTDSKKPLNKVTSQYRPQNSFVPRSQSFQNFGNSYNAGQQPAANQQSFPSTPISNFNRANNAQYQSNNQKRFEGDINRPLNQPNRLPTNKQVFGTKPGSNISKMRYQPTPMSVQTRVHSQQFRPNTSYRPQPIFEELHNVESTEIENAENFPENFCENYAELEYENPIQEEENSENFNNENFHLPASETLE